MSISLYLQEFYHFFFSQKKDKSSEIRSNRLCIEWMLSFQVQPESKLSSSLVVLENMSLNLYIIKSLQIIGKMQYLRRSQRLFIHNLTRPLFSMSTSAPCPHSQLLPDGLYEIGIVRPQLICLKVDQSPQNTLSTNIDTSTPFYLQNYYAGGVAVFQLLSDIHTGRYLKATAEGNSLQESKESASRFRLKLAQSCYKFQYLGPDEANKGKYLAGAEIGEPLRLIPQDSECFILREL